MSDEKKEEGDKLPGSPEEIIATVAENGKLHQVARAYLNSLKAGEIVAAEAYIRFYPLITSWKSKKPDEWTLFHSKVRHLPMEERRIAKLTRAVEFAEFRRSGIKDAQTTARKALQARKDAMREERRKANVLAANEVMRQAQVSRNELASTILDFPPAYKKGSPLGHDGRLSALEVAHLKELGYDVQHYKQAIGPRQVELYLQGCILGTIEYDEMKFKAVESMRKHYMRMTKQEAEEELKQRKVANPVTLLQKWGSPLGTEKFDGQRVELRTAKIKMSKRELEIARAEKLTDLIEMRAEDKILDPVKPIVPAGELAAAIAARKAEEEAKGVKDG